MRAGWQAIRDEAQAFCVTEQEFMLWCATWNIRSLEQDGETVGIWATNGARCHVAIMPRARGRWSLRLLREMVLPVLLEHGRMETIATSEAGRDFVERIGFKREQATHVLRAAP